MKTHKTRAREWLEGIGWTVDDVERRIPGGRTKDLFGFADLLAIDPDETGQTLALQVTSPSNVAARVKKLLAEPRVAACLAVGWTVEVWGVRDELDRSGSWLKSRILKLRELDGTREVIVADGSAILEI